MEIYPDKPVGSVLQIVMPRRPRIYAPGAMMHVVARCNNQESYFTIPEGFEGAPGPFAGNGPSPSEFQSGGAEGEITSETAIKS